MCLGSPDIPPPPAPPPAPAAPAQRVDEAVLNRRKRDEARLRQRNRAAQRIFSKGNGPLQSANTASPSLMEL